MMSDKVGGPLARWCGSDVEVEDVRFAMLKTLFPICLPLGLGLALNLPTESGGMLRQIGPGRGQSGWECSNEDISLTTG